MGGPRLEVVKFGIYVFFPVGTMLYFGGPEFYDKYVKGIKFWPDYETTHKPPTTPEDVKDTLAKLKAEREERWRQAALKKE
ncbi:hypothetical protein G6F70_001343 [Rhizopus microsporus]|uniref:Protein PET100, mitochondrial n=2 Tax=Rhizopus TaxID=4842 RepID=A0A367J3Q6_RHIAZ|nr:hypothetical protein G6F71_001785 [Rhizopus microsporus]RCH84351.1 hypothetical protein CU097_005280 [Rhizopus azygosporus]KAG1203476.1 hypothetical protein G6F70_001343 [Rhizopus microsporus]KAG1215109.1 hypothetical protein G6F69_001306 [Rhizopus microsporus]KAG1237496.1 hypothetical protein G6F67_001174 [Rhizopus microsporus]